ncbi:MAG: hypothetical protein MZV65_17705 [Chromatiales bacterium]|nr:hypothetical protein [Chromatiales bacterium]
MGFINATGCTSVWGSTCPYNPYPVPVDQPPVPGRALGGDGRVRGPHGQDGRRLQARSAHGRAGTERRVPTRPQHDDFFRLLRLAAVQRRGVACCARRWSRSAATARCTTSASRTSRALLMSGMPIKVLVVDTQVYSEHRRPGLHLRLHRPGVGHGAVRQGAARQAGDRARKSA